MEGVRGSGPRLHRGPGSADATWRYSRVPRWEAATAAAAAGEANGEREPTGSSCASEAALLRAAASSAWHGGAGACVGPQCGGRIAWAGPALTLLGALFLETAGVYSATGSYVRWMDELTKAEDAAGLQKAAQAITLDDPLLGWLEGHRLFEAVDIPWICVTWIDIATCLLSVVWLGWVAHMKDLGLWTHSLLSGTALALLKGLLAWATVLPDSAGWLGCQERLGEDRLAYFREKAIGGDASRSFLDMPLLELQGLWVLDHAGHQRLCADTVFSGPTCFCVLLCAGLYDAARSWTEGVEAWRRNVMMGAVGFTLGLVLLASLALALVGPQRHYTLDVALALALASLVHGSPAVALASQWWLDMWEAGPEPLGCEKLEEIDDEPVLRDLGQVVVLPCCLPFWSLAGVYHLRDDPGEAGLRPWTEECERRHRQRLAEFAEIREREAAGRRRAEADIAREHGRVREHEAEVAEQCQERLDEELRRLGREEKEALAVAGQRLKEQRASAMRLQERAAGEARRAAFAKAELSRTRSQLAGAAERLRGEAARAREECALHERRIQECELELLALQKVLFRHADPAVPWEGEGTKEVDAEPCEEPAGPDVPLVDGKEAPAGVDNASLDVKEPSV